MDGFYGDFLSYFSHMSTREWLFVATVGAVIGIMCMRGLGSRTNY